jgi:acetyl esterase/lipase
MERYLTHPYASPLFGDFSGLPPLLIQAGESEVLRDEVTLLAHKATLAGVQVMHELYEDAVSLHVSSLLVSLSMVVMPIDSCISSIPFPRGLTARLLIVPRLRETRVCPRSTPRSPST